MSGQEREGSGGQSPSEDPGYSLITPEDMMPGSPYGSADAARLGLDRNTVEGAQLHFFGRLDSTKPFHRLFAWSALLILVVLPALITLAELLHG